jgi:hypothetical protein
MPPLPEALATILKTNATAALAALMLIANAHRDLYAWASRAILGDASSADLEPKPRSNGGVPNARKAPKRAKPNGHREPRLDPRTVKRDSDDEALVRVMRATPEGKLGGWAEAIGKSRSSVVTALHRLRDVGLVENEDGKWRLTEEPATKEPPPR